MTDDYVLGTDPEELRRLWFQHVVWLEQGYALWTQAGLRAGQTVLDLGSGPGFTSFELARIVGPRGRVIARDQSARFLEFLASERDRLGLAWIEPSLGPVEELDLPAASLDAAYARWLFCWLGEPGAVLEKVARALKPRGALVLQEYLDWGAMKLVPRSELFDRVVAACLASWRAAGATMDIGDHVPALAERAKLSIELFRPEPRLGRVGSLEWRWLSDFFRSYLPKVAERGLLSQADLAAHFREWDARERAGTSWCYPPTVAAVILRKD